MSRRWLAQSVVLGLVIVSASTASAEDPPTPEPPRVGCAKAIVDPANDAAPVINAAIPTSAAYPSKPEVDLLGLHVRLTADQFQLFMPLGAAPTTAGMKPFEFAYRYISSFKLAGKTITLGYQLSNPTLGSVAIPTFGNVSVPADSTSYPLAQADTLPINKTGSTFGVVPAAAPQPAFIRITVPRPMLEAALGAPLTSTDQFSALTATTEVFVLPQPGSKADRLDLITPEQAVRDVGDDFCFGPAPTAFSGLTATPVQYGDSTTLGVTLKGGEKDEPLADTDVVFSADTGTLATTKTNAEGVASAAVPVALTAGSYPFAASYAGTPEFRSATLSGTLVVKPEVTVFNALAIAKPNSTTRTATATLLDDDKKPVARQKVEWWVNGKKVATTTTDAAGKTAYKTLKPGQTVQAKFALVLNTYTASASKAVKV